MQLPDFAVAFFREALAPGIREAALLVARKNAKTACIAVLILAFLVGPLRRVGWAAGVVSVNREKTGVLKKQIQNIAEASGLHGLTFRRSPAPGSVASDTGEVEFLSADRSSGHASSFDLALIDEIGLLAERDRPLVDGMISSTSAKDGRLIAISIVGDAPFTRELIDRRDAASVVVHLHQAPEGCALDDEAAWEAANPGLLSGIKSRSYMADLAQRAMTNPNNATSFRSFELNLPQSPTREMVCDVGRWQACECPGPRLDDAAPRAGDCFIGLDLGGTCSMTAAVAYWPASGRIECWGAFGDQPDLVARGQGDGVGELYRRMAEAGAVRTFPGRVTPVAPFLEWIAGELAGQPVAGAAADRYRQGEALDALTAAGVVWPMDFRPSGAGPSGGADIRAFQDAVEGGKLKSAPSLLIKAAIANSEIRRDPNGNPGLHKGRQRGRIDALSAAVLAVGLGTTRTARPPPECEVFHIPLSQL